MRRLDQVAGCSPLKNQDPLEKLVFAMVPLLICIGLNRPLVSLAVLVTMGWRTVRKGSLPFFSYIKLLLLPISFLLLSLIAIIFNYSPTGNELSYAVPLFNGYVGLSREGLLLGFSLFFKALAAVSCLYYLILNTPAVDFFSALKRVRVPSLLIQLMGLIYRFIDVFAETAHQMILAQKSRLGYLGLKNSYLSLGTLAAQLFVKSYRNSDALYTGLEARGYEGDLTVLEETERYVKAGHGPVLGVSGLLLAIACISYILEKR